MASHTMDLTPEAQKTLDELQAKRAQPSITTTDGAGKILPLIPGGKVPDSQSVALLKDFVKKVEAGEIMEFVVVAVKPDHAGAELVFSHNPPSKATWALVGAMHTVTNVLARTISG